MKRKMLVLVLLLCLLSFTGCGDSDQWYFPAYAVRDTEIRMNDRICQFRIMEHQPQFVFEETEKLPDQSRGGFGSTGVR